MAFDEYSEVSILRPVLVLERRGAGIAVGKMRFCRDVGAVAEGRPLSGGLKSVVVVMVVVEVPEVEDWRPKLSRAP